MSNKLKIRFEKMIVEVKTPTKEYPIYINNSFVGLKNAFIKAGLDKRKICIVADSNTAELFLKQVINELEGFDVVSTYFEAGEGRKTLSTISKLYEFFLGNGLDRKSVLIALGGGVVGDMTGFAAATYMRGISFVQVPTTILSQVDSSVGGKTGVDFMGGKNLIGAFYQPEFVYINTDSLLSLPEREIAGGLAEAIKYGYIIDESLLEYFYQNTEKLNSLSTEEISYIIAKSCECKAYVVSKDEKESGLREILNFGHTFGHAIESLSNFTFLHGECVALGMVSALYLCMKKGVISENELLKAENALKALKLPVRAKGFKADDVLDRMLMDKKNKNGQINLVLLNKLGEAYTDNGVSRDEILEAIDYILI